MPSITFRKNNTPESIGKKIGLSDKRASGVSIHTSEDDEGPFVTFSYEGATLTLSQLTKLKQFADENGWGGVV